jgi:hypothetical protein
MERGVEDIRRVFDGVWVGVGAYIELAPGFAWKRWRIRLHCLALVLFMIHDSYSQLKMLFFCF